MVVPGGGAISHEGGTPVKVLRAGPDRVKSDQLTNNLVKGGQLTHYC